MAQNTAVVRLKLDTDGAKQSAAELAVALKRTLGGIKINTKLVDFGDAQQEIKQLTAELARAKAALQQLASVDVGLSAEDIAKAKALADELGKINPDRLADEFDKLGDKAGDSLGLMKNLLQGIAQGAGQQVFSIIANAASTLPSLIAENTLEFEKFRTVLTTLLGSADQADAAFAQIRQFSDTTPFGVAEVTDTFIKLKQRGLDPTIATLTLLGDISASQGKSLDQLTEAILDATTGEFERLKEFGINASSAGDKVTLSFKGVNKEVSKTPQAIQEAILGFGKLQGVQGGMEALGKTLGGQLSTLQDNISGAAVAFGNELLPILTEFVTEINGSAGGVKELARELGQGVAPLVQLLANAIRLAADNGQILTTVIGALVTRMLVLKAVGLVDTISTLSLAFASFSLKVAASATSLQGLTVAQLASAAASKKLSLATAPLLIQLAALTAAIAAVQIAVFVRDLTEANTAFEGFRGGVEASTGAAIAAAERTKAAADALNKSRKDGTALTKAEIDSAKKLAAANDLRLKQLREDLKLAEALPAADESQRNAKDGLIKTIQASIGALEKQNNALRESAGLSQKKTQAVKDEESALERTTRLYEESVQRVELAATQRQVAIAQAVAAGTKSEEEGAAETLAIEQDSLRQRIELLQANLPKLRALKSDSPEETRKINAEILSAEQELASAQLSLAQNTAEQKQQIEQQALSGLEEQLQEQEAQFSLSQQRRIQAIRESQAAGVLGEREAQEQIAALQEESTRKTIALKQQEIAQLNQLRSTGRIGEEEFDKRTLAARQAIATASIQLAEQEIARRQQLLQTFEQNQRQAEQAIAQSQQQRILAIREAEQQGVISAEEAQRQIQQIELSGIDETIAAKQRQISEIRALRQQGVLDAEQAAQRETQLAIEVGNLTIQQIEAETAAARQAAEEQIALQQQLAQAKLDAQQASLNLQSEALQNESNLLNAQVELQTSLNSLQQEQLNTRIASAEAAGNQLEADRLRGEQLALQSDQLDAQFKAQEKQLEIQQQQRRIQVEQNRLQAESARLEAEAELAKARANNADERQLQLLEQVVGIRERQLQQINETAAGLKQIEALETRNLETNQRITRERLQQQQIQQQAARNQQLISEAGGQLDTGGTTRTTGQQVRAQEQLTQETDKTADAFSGLTDLVEQFKKAFSGFGFPGLQARRNGGPVRSGQAYLVGEEGPELVLPKKSGYVLTASETAKILGESAGRMGVRMPRSTSRDDSPLLREIQELRKDLRKNRTQNNNSFTFVNEQDPTEKMLQINEQMQRQQLRRQGF